MKFYLNTMIDFDVFFIRASIENTAFVGMPYRCIDRYSKGSDGCNMIHNSFKTIMGQCFVSSDINRSGLSVCIISTFSCFSSFAGGVWEILFTIKITFFRNLKNFTMEDDANLENR